MSNKLILRLDYFAISPRALDILTRSLKEDASTDDAPDTPGVTLLLMDKTSVVASSTKAAPLNLAAFSMIGSGDNDASLAIVTSASYRYHHRWAEGVTNWTSSNLYLCES